MRIRTKFLCLLLALVLPPLMAVSFYALRQGRQLGDQLANHTAEAFKHSAEQELALMVDLIGEDLMDNRQMLELSLTLLAQNAGHALSAAAPPDVRPYFVQDFDASSDGLPPGLSRLTGTGVPTTADTMVFLPPPSGKTDRTSAEAKRLLALLPTMDTLREKLGENMLWAFVALPDGLQGIFPGHGHVPENYDARTRLWYRQALAHHGTAWSILVDAVTGRLTSTVSTPIYDAKGRLLGVAGLDAPLETMLPESDLSRRWGQGVRALIVAAHDSDHGPQVSVLGNRDFLVTTHGWNTPLKPIPLTSSDTAALGALAGAILKGQSQQMSLPLDGHDYFAVFKPFPEAQAGLLVLVPREAVLRQADSAETTILARTNTMLTVVVSFTLVAIIGAVVLAFLGARAVTRPVTALCQAAGKLAQGDLDARAPVAGRDELAALAETFNGMAPKLAERLRLKQDLRLAMEVQQNLLPQKPPQLPGLDIAGATIFCDETGGDYFDYLRLLPTGSAGCDVAVGDATGHGIAAALFMATGRALLRGGRGADPDPAALLTLASSLLYQDTMDTGRFLTLFLLRLENGGLAPRGRLLWARAGHDPALLYDPATKSFEEMLGPGLPLGVLPDFAYEEQSRPGLLPGQLLALGTDGIWEARDPTGAMYGKDRFRAVLQAQAGAPAKDIIAAVQQDVADFQAGAPRDDDITLVIIKAVAAA